MVLIVLAVSALLFFALSDIPGVVLPVSAVGAVRNWLLGDEAGGRGDDGRWDGEEAGDCPAEDLGEDSEDEVQDLGDQTALNDGGRAREKCRGVHTKDRSPEGPAEGDDVLEIDVH